MYSGMSSRAAFGDAAGGTVKELPHFAQLPRFPANDGGKSYCALQLGQATRAAFWLTDGMKVMGSRRDWTPLPDTFEYTVNESIHTPILITFAAW